MKKDVLFERRLMIAALLFLLTFVSISILPVISVSKGDLPMGRFPVCWIYLVCWDSPTSTNVRSAFVALISTFVVSAGLATFVASRMPGRKQRKEEKEGQAS